MVEVAPPGRLGAQKAQQAPQPRGREQRLGAFGGEQIGRRAVVVLERHRALALGERQDVVVGVHDQHALDAFADQAGIAIERAERLESLRARERELAEANRELAATRSELEDAGIQSSPFSAAEAEELQAMEDGDLGELAVEDIVLYRAIVHLRIGEPRRHSAVTKRRSSILQPTSWFQKTLLGMVEDDSAASDEFQRAVDLWEEAQKNIGPTLEESASWVALSVQFTVDEGILAAYTPLHSTLDQAPSKRLQMLFLSFVYSKFHAHARLLGDFESMRLDTVLQDFQAEEDDDCQVSQSIASKRTESSHEFILGKALSIRSVRQARVRRHGFDSRRGATDNRDSGQGGQQTGHNGDTSVFAGSCLGGGLLLCSS